MSEENQPLGKKVSKTSGRSASSSKAVGPRELLPEFQTPEFPAPGSVTRRISAIHEKAPSGTVEQPTASRPSYVHLRSGPKLVGPQKPHSKKGFATTWRRSDQLEVGVTSPNPGSAGISNSREEDELTVPSLHTQSYIESEVVYDSPEYFFWSSS